MTYKQLLRLLNKSGKSENNGEIVRNLLSRYGDKRTERLIRNFISGDRKKLQAFSKYHGLHDEGETINNKQILYRAAYSPTMRDVINAYKKDLRDTFSTYSFSYRLYMKIDQHSVYDAYTIATSPYCSIAYIYEDYEPRERDEGMAYMMELVLKARERHVLK